MDRESRNLRQALAAQLRGTAARVGRSPNATTFPSRARDRGAVKFASGTRGQGILLVDGDFELVGGFEWTGLILIKGQMKITGTGNKIHGAILTGGRRRPHCGRHRRQRRGHLLQVRIDRAVNGAAQPAPVSRGWAQLF